MDHRGAAAGCGRQAGATHHRRGVVLGDNPHGGNFVLRCPLEESPPGVVWWRSHGHATTAASLRQVGEEREDHMAFIRGRVRRLAPPPCRF